VKNRNAFRNVLVTVVCYTSRETGSTTPSTQYMQKFRSSLSEAKEEQSSDCA
jgi:hypothetical protein